MPDSSTVPQRWRKYLPGLFALAMLVGSVSGCRSYQFGATTLHNCTIRSVYVPMIESDSYRRYLGPRLTEAVVKQIELDTPFVIAAPEYADSFLVAKILRDSKTVQAETTNDDPRSPESRNSGRSHVDRPQRQPVVAATADKNQSGPRFHSRSRPVTDDGSPGSDKQNRPRHRQSDGSTLVVSDQRPCLLLDSQRNILLPSFGNSGRTTRLIDSLNGDFLIACRI